MMPCGVVYFCLFFLFHLIINFLYFWNIKNKLKSLGKLKKPVLWLRQRHAFVKWSRTSCYCLDTEFLRATCCFLSPHPLAAHLHITLLLRQQAQACHLYLHGAWHLHTGKAIRPEPGSLIQWTGETCLLSKLLQYVLTENWKWRHLRLSVLKHPRGCHWGTKMSIWIPTSLRLLFFCFSFILRLSAVNTHTRTLMKACSINTRVCLSLAAWI